MFIKKIFILLAMTIFITGCGNKNDDSNSVSLNFNEREKYKEQIYALMYDYYWRYDSSTVEFFASSVPEDIEENEKIFDASSDIDLSLERYSGDNCVVVTMDLQHFNGDYAGRGYYYFIKDKLRGAYYTANDDKPYSFGIRNIFVNSPSFTGYESDEVMATFKEYKSYVDVDGFSDTSKDNSGKFMALSVNGDNLNIYKYSNKSLVRSKSVYMSSNGLVPLSACFIGSDDDFSGVAVIMGEYVVEEDEHFHEEGDTYSHEEDIYTVSKKVVFLNDNFNKTGQEILLSDSNCNSIFYDDDYLSIVAGDYIEYYANGENGFEKVGQFRLGHTANHVHITDLDGDGSKEYIMTDGFDLYMYKKEGTDFINVWRTHITVNNFTGYIYSGDLNNDGTKEVYVSDITGTAIRYILKENGLITSNEDIEYGNNIYACDFNNDGKDDYIKIVFGENTKQSMCIQQ